MCAEGWREHTAEGDALVDRAHLGRVHHDWYDVLYRRVMMLMSGKRRTGTRRKVQAFEKLGLVGGLNRLQVACGEALLEPHLTLYHIQSVVDT